MKNREIKFRAWCSGTHGAITFPNSEMEYGVMLSKKGFYLGVENGWDIQCEIFTVPIMQYTGVKDKNGVEVYEGDIVNLGLKNNFIVDYSNGSFILINIKYKDDEHSLRIWGNVSRTQDSDLIDRLKLKVIGNIYEDSDLL